MSTLRVNNITDTTGGSNLNVPGTAKAWVNFNGTGTSATNQTIRASLNVSSVYKNGTGDYTINFVTAMTDANYSMSLSASGVGNGTVFGTDGYADLANVPRTAGSIRFYTVTGGLGSTSPYKADPSVVNLPFTDSFV